MARARIAPHDAWSAKKAGVALEKDCGCGWGGACATTARGTAWRAPGASAAQVGQPRVLEAARNGRQPLLAANDHVAGGILRASGSRGRFQRTKTSAFDELPQASRDRTNAPVLSPADTVLWGKCFPELARKWAAHAAEGESFDATPTPPVRAHEIVPERSDIAESRSWTTVEGGVVKYPEPVAVRLMLAVSWDGVHWTKTGEVIANHGSVPALAVEDGVLYLFFNTSRREIAAAFTAADMAAVDPDPRPTPLAVAYTTDLVNWTYRLIGDHGAGITYTISAEHPAAPDMQALDPSVLRNPNAGSAEAWFLYFTLRESLPAERARTHLATAARLSDFAWTHGNAGEPVFPPLHNFKSGDSAEDPSVFWVEEGGYFQYISGRTDSNPPSIWSVLLDVDGVTPLNPGLHLPWAGGLEDNFVTATCGGLSVALSNPLRDEGGLIRWFGFTNEAAVEASLVSALVPVEDLSAAHLIWAPADIEGLDGSGTACSPVLVVDRDYESHGVKDAAVAQFGNCYVMVYVTAIPAP